MELFLNSEHISGFNLREEGGNTTKTQPKNHKESIETIVRGKNRMWLQPKLLGRRCRGEMKTKRNNYPFPHWLQISMAKHRAVQPSSRKPAGCLPQKQYLPSGELLLHTGLEVEVALLVHSSVHGSSSGVCQAWFSNRSLKLAAQELIFLFVCSYSASSLGGSLSTSSKRLTSVLVKRGYPLRLHFTEAEIGSAYGQVGFKGCPGRPGNDTYITPTLLQCDLADNNFLVLFAIRNEVSGGWHPL